MSRLTDYQHPIFAPLELVKDQSVLKARGIAAALLVGHPLYYWAWTRLDPQPYESALWRGSASVLGLISLVAMIRLSVGDRRAAWAYGVATAFGTVFIASWFYVANGGNTVWLASLCAMTMLYFTLTDWRIATAVTTLSWVGSYVLVSTLGIGVWADSSDHRVFDFTAILILGFALSVSILSRYTDMSMRAVRMRSQMRALGITAHEIRTPLAGMQLLSSALKERVHEVKVKPGSQCADAHKEVSELADDLVRACQDANALIATHLANANPFKPFGRRAAVNIADMAAEAIAVFQRGAGSREKLVDLRVFKNFSINADRGVLQQALVNLLNNSLKAVVLRHRGAAPGQISVSIDFDRAGLLTVTDRGTGVRKEDMPKLFEPFHTGDPDHGHGLGLTYVHSVVTAYGGTICVDSVEGEGTTITIMFLEAQSS